jgi:hypothetical protein
MIRGRPPRSTAVALLEAHGLPAADITEANLEHFFFNGSDCSPMGLVGLELYSTEALLRSLVSNAPPSIARTHEFAGLCPASSAFMNKRINPDR